MGQTLTDECTKSKLHDADILQFYHSLYSICLMNKNVTDEICEHPVIQTIHISYKEFVQCRLFSTP